MEDDLAESDILSWVKKSEAQQTDRQKERKKEVERLIRLNQIFNRE